MILVGMDLVARLVVWMGLVVGTQRGEEDSQVDSSRVEKIERQKGRERIKK